MRLKSKIAILNLLTFTASQLPLGSAGARPLNPAGAALDGVPRARMDRNRLRDLVVARPDAQVSLVPPPVADGTGDAVTALPIEVPRGRNGLEPKLALSYRSSAGSGFVGVGWDLVLPSITVDTRWGVPRYSATEETETYLLDGEQLTPLAHRGSPVPRAAEKTFHERVEGGFRKIVRHGDSPKSYWWEVTDPYGVTAVYGDPGGAAPGLCNRTAPGAASGFTLRDTKDDIYHWALREVRDLHGNSISYAYDVVADTGLGDGTGGATSGAAPLYGYEIYPTRIEYTRFGGAPAPYSVSFEREATRRPDVRIDARGGFKRVTAARLRRIAVAFQNQPIRSYLLEYHTGRLSESLLASVAQRGADESAFQVHSFTYTDNPPGFRNVVEPWNTGADGLIAPEIAADPISSHANASVLGASKTLGGGGGTYVGFNPFTPTKQNSFGGKFWFDISTNTGFVELVDVNGDGLPDKVWSDGSGFKVRLNRAAPTASSPLGITAFGNPVSLQAFPGISTEQTLLFSGGPEAYPAAFGVLYNHAETFTTGSTYLVDVNGDGLMDVVSNGVVHFNGGATPGGGFDFSLDSRRTPVPIDASGAVSAAVIPDLSAFHQNFPLADAVRRWVAPFDGTIAIASPSIALGPATSTHADGVRVAIQHNGTELWSAPLTPGQSTNAHLPNVAVRAGERIYFRVQSIDDGSDDRVAWSPAITYVGKTPDTDVNGLPLYAYEAAKDFAVVGAAPTLTMPFTGTARVAASVTKLGATTDDVSLALLVNGAEVARETVRAATTGAATMYLPFAVQRGDKVVVHVAIDSPVDLAQLRLDPAVFSYDHAVDESGHAVTTTDADGVPLTTRTMLVPDSYPSNGLASPQPPWIADADGTVTVTPTIAFDTAPEAPVVFTVKKRGALVGKITFPRGSKVGSAANVAVPVTKGDAVYFDFSCADPAARRQLGFSVALDGNRAAPPAVLHTGFRDPDDSSLFASAYRQWSFIAYNGEGPLATSPMAESAFRVDATELKNTCPAASSVGSIEDLKKAGSCQVPMDAAWAFTPDPVLGPNGLPAFRGPSAAIYADALHLSSSRRGTTSGRAPRAGERMAAVERVSHTTQDSFEGNVGPVGGNASIGSSESKLDYMDMNGDEFPDVVSVGRIQFTTPGGALGAGVSTSVPDDKPVRFSSVLSYAVSVGANPPGFSANAEGRVGSSKGGAPRGSKNGGQMPPLGFGAGMGFGSSDRPGTSTYDYLDMNGDGLPDRILSDGTHLTVWLNLGYSFGPAEDWSAGAGVPLGIGQAASANVGLNVGFNDGAYGYAGGVSVQRQTSLEGCQESAPGSWPDASGCRTRGSVLIDVTGDGLPDTVTAGPGGLSVAFNTGSSFVARPGTWSAADAVARSTTTTVGGGGFFTVPIGPLCLFACWIIVNPGFDVQSSLARQESAIRDVDGDGFADYVTSTSDGRMFVARNTRAGSNLLATIERPLGGKITMAYRRDGNTPEMPQSHFVLSGVIIDDGHPGDGVDVRTTTYQYAGGKYDRLERASYGYGEVVEEHRRQHRDPRTTPPTPDYAGEVYRLVRREYATDSYYAKGLPRREIFLDGAGRPFVERRFAYAFVDAVTGAPADTASTTAAIFPAQTSTTESFYEGQPEPAPSTTVLHRYDALGRITMTVDAGDDGPEDDVVTTYTYATCAATHVHARATEVLVRAASGATLSRRQYTVDCATGEVTQERAFADEESAAVTDLAYFPDGNVRRLTGPENAAGDRYEQTFAYDDVTRSRITSATDSFGYMTTATYDPRFGALETSTDTNGNTTSYTYDAYGRLTSVTAPNEQVGTTPTVSFEYHHDARVPWAVTRRYDVFHPGDTLDTVLFVDGVGRILQEKSDAAVFTGATTPAANVMRVSGQATYDDFGRVAAVRFPTTEPLGTPGAFSSAVDAVAPTVMTYDVLDRALTITRPDGSTSSRAFGLGHDRSGALRFQTTSIDAGGVVTRAYDDVRRRTRAVERTLDGGRQSVWTRYAYDPLGRRTQVIDDRDNVTSTAYDLLGRRTAVARADGGRTTFAYDLAGNLVERRTPNLTGAGGTIRYSYQFTRLSDVEYPTFPEHSIHYLYGEPGAPDNGAGRIVLVRDAAGSEARSYGKMGEVTKTVRTLRDDPWGGGQSAFATQLTYDSFGRLRTLTYPDGEVLAYGYDSGGALQSARGTKAGIAYPYVQRIEYDTLGAEAFYQSGNGVQRASTYDARSRRLATLRSSTRGYTFQDNAYSYDAVGNVTSITNRAALPPPSGVGGPSTQTFGHDDLHRLTSASGTYQLAAKKQRRYTLHQAYDTIDNILSKEQVDEVVQPNGHVVPVFPTTYALSYRYDGPHPHAPTHVGDRTYAYDADGNQIATADDLGGPRRMAVWDDEDRLATLAQNGGWQSYLYDDRGDRVVRVGSQGKTVYVGEYMTLTNGAFAVKHVFAGATRVVSKRVAQGEPPSQPNPAREDDQVFFHHDHSGNVTFTTNAAGALTQHLEYFPFGEAWIEETSGPEPSPYRFVGKELEPVSGLYYFGARYYDARTSTWTSVDPVDDHGVRSPYGYARANPLAFVDPDGRTPMRLVVGSRRYKQYAEHAIAYRRANPKTNGRNVATVAYEQDGQTLFETLPSAGGYHSEARLHKFLRENGITPDRVRWFYTEREPCGPDCHNCASRLADTWGYGDVPVYYTFKYSDKTRINTVSTKDGSERDDAELRNVAKKRRKRSTFNVKRLQLAISRELSLEDVEFQTENSSDEEESDTDDEDED